MVGCVVVAGAQDEPGAALDAVDVRVDDAVDVPHVERATRAWNSWSDTSIARRATPAAARLIRETGESPWSP